MDSLEIGDEKTSPLESRGSRRTPRGFTAALVTATAVGLSLFQLYTAGISPLAAIYQRSVHLVLIMVITFALFPPARRASRTRLDAYLIFDWLLPASLAMRVAVSVLLLAPVGFMMGFPFPLAVRLADRECPLMVPWGWAVNAYGGVLGSFLSVIIAIYLGFTVVYVAAVLVYALAGLLLVRLRARYSA